jgi:transcriptional regulator with XRE-family HTH domain
MRTAPPMPLPVKRALAKLGADLRAARIRRKIPTTLMAERAMITRTTLTKIERGDAGVSMGLYATVLFLLGMSEKLEKLADIGHDEVGLALIEEALPKQVRRKRSSKKED